MKEVGAVDDTPSARLVRQARQKPAGRSRCELRRLCGKFCAAVLNEPAHDGPLVRSVLLEAVREQFQKDKIGDSHDTIRRAFGRALDRADQEGLVIKFRTTDGECLYFKNKDDEAGIDAE
jgi:hypothetical protein